MLAIVTPPLTLVLIETFHNGTPLLQKESKRKNEKTAENELCVVRLACVFRLLPPIFASSARMGTKDYHPPRARLVFVNSLFILIVVARGHRFMRLVFASHDNLTRTSLAHQKSSEIPNSLEPADRPSSRTFTSICASMQMRMYISLYFSSAYVESRVENSNKPTLSIDERFLLLTQNW